MNKIDTFLISYLRSFEKDISNVERNLFLFLNSNEETVIACSSNNLEINNKRIAEIKKEITAKIEVDLLLSEVLNLSGITIKKE